MKSNSVVRVLKNEIETQNNKESVQILDEHRILVDGKRIFTVDHVLGPSSMMEDVLRLCEEDIKQFINGKHLTMICYGQTENDHFITVLLEYLLLNLENGPIQWSMKASFVEIYNEQIYDLLDQSRTALSIFGSSSKLLGAISLPIHSLNDALKLFTQGAMNRTRIFTAENTQSSRSHAIFTIYLETIHPNIDGSVQRFYSQLNFVDLAVSQRSILKNTSEFGDRDKEGIFIQSGLLALENLIQSYSFDSHHSSFGDSKLTRLLQHSFGGDNRLIIMASILPNEAHTADTLYTLGYASRTSEPVYQIQSCDISELDHLRQYSSYLEAKLERAYPQESVQKILEENARLKETLEDRTLEIPTLIDLSVPLSPNGSFKEEDDTMDTFETAHTRSRTLSVDDILKITEGTQTEHLSLNDKSNQRLKQIELTLQNLVSQLKYRYSEFEENQKENIMSKSIYNDIPWYKLVLNELQHLIKETTGKNSDSISEQVAYRTEVCVDDTPKMFSQGSSIESYELETSQEELVRHHSSCQIEYAGAAKALSHVSVQTDSFQSSVQDQYTTMDINASKEVQTPFSESDIQESVKFISSISIQTETTQISRQDHSTNTLINTSDKDIQMSVAMIDCGIDAPINTMTSKNTQIERFSSFKDISIQTISTLSTRTLPVQTIVPANEFGIQVGAQYFPKTNASNQTEEHYTAPLLTALEKSSHLIKSKAFERCMLDHFSAFESSMGRLKTKLGLCELKASVLQSQYEERFESQRMEYGDEIERLRGLLKDRNDRLVSSQNETQRLEQKLKDLNEETLILKKTIDVTAEERDLYRISTHKLESTVETQNGHIEAIQESMTDLRKRFRSRVRKEAWTQTPSDIKLVSIKTLFSSQSNIHDTLAPLQEIMDKTTMTNIVGQSVATQTSFRLTKSLPTPPSDSEKIAKLQKDLQFLEQENVFYKKMFHRRGRSFEQVAPNEFVYLPNTQSPAEAKHPTEDALSKLSISKPFIL